jgi:hypothetical protein
MYLEPIRPFGAGGVLFDRNSPFDEETSRTLANIKKIAPTALPYSPSQGVAILPSTQLWSPYVQPKPSSQYKLVPPTTPKYTPPKQTPTRGGAGGLLGKIGSAAPRVGGVMTLPKYAAPSQRSVRF